MTGHSTPCQAGCSLRLVYSKKSGLSSPQKFLFTIPMKDLALVADLTHCVLGFKSSVKCTPKSLLLSVV